MFIPLVYDSPSYLLSLFSKKISQILRQQTNIDYKVDTRLGSLPCGFSRSSIGNIGVEDSEKLVYISGTVILCGSIKSLAFSKDFKCCLCGYEFRLEASISLFNSFDLPSSCLSSRCKSNSFEEILGTEDWIDYREIKIYDAFTSAYRGKLPQSLWVLLTSEQVGVCTPGDDISITGIITKRWFPFIKLQTCEMQLALLASTIHVHNSKIQRSTLETVEKEKLNDFELRKVILSSFAPLIYGCDAIKLGILLSIIGGVREDVGSLHLRGHCHCLLLGEPGTGKSDLLREACKLISRGVYTNAIGASKAGLTLSAVKEGNDWMLEAGALVLADCGICALDDLSFLNKEDLSEIYECMENQTISVAKAGMVCTVNTRTTIIAACRPKKSRFDFGLNIEENSCMPSPLLSRFDLIFLLVDTPDQEADFVKSKFILNKNIDKDKILSPGQLQYVMSQALAFKPRICPSESETINRYFELLRTENGSDVTMRQLESLIRLAQAHARLCQRDKVEVFDCISIILLYEASHRGVGLTTHNSFISEPLFQLGFNEILNRLGYNNFLIDDSILE